MSCMNRKRGTSIGLALLCAGVVMTSGAIADPTTESVNVSVSYVTADLATPAAAEKLYHHIRRAAKIACGEPDIRRLTEQRLYRACFDRAVDAAVSKVDSSVLTALHRSYMQRGAAG